MWGGPLWSQAARRQLRRRNARTTFSSAMRARTSSAPRRSRRCCPVYRTGLKSGATRPNLLPGQQVDFAIPAALRDAKVVVVLWSPQSIGSDWVRHEAGYAVVEGKAATLAISPFDYGVLPLDLPRAPLRRLRRHPRRSRAAPEAARRAEQSCGAQPAAPHRHLPHAHHLRLAPVRPRGRDGGPEQGLGQRRGGQDQRRRARRHGRNRQDRAGQPLRAGPRGQGWRGAEAVFVWSFYSQGTDDKRQASADEFFKTALAWFGHTGDAPHSRTTRACGSRS